MDGLLIQSIEKQNAVDSCDRIVGQNNLPKQGLDESFGDSLR
jgi:hypothetical protein